MSQRLRLARHVAFHGAARFKTALSAPFREIASLRIRSPERLVIVPKDIRTTDPTIANDIYAGYFAFGGKIVNAHGRSPFEIVAAPTWERALAGFSWLRHLQAAETRLARANAQALVDEFLSLRGKPTPTPSWETRVTARRVLSWLSQSPLLLEGVDQIFYRRFMRGLSRARLHLLRALADGQDGEARLIAAVALSQYALCVQTTPKEQKRATKALAEELSRQILPDGGHLSRNPQALVDLLLDLLPLRQAYIARSAEAPQELIEAIDRMGPMLRMFRFEDGTLALFNGMGVTAAEAIATLLAYDDPRGRALTNAPHSGYQRIEAGAAVLVMDCGKPPPPAFSQRAHAGCLSFEFCYGRQRVIVNCGAPDANREAARDAARATAAHSTLVVADTSSCRFAAHTPLRQLLEGQILSGPEHVGVARREEQGATVLAARHDGYLHGFGLTHERVVQLGPDGMRLDGEDRLQPAARRGRAAEDAAYALRFHIHPAVHVERIWAGEGALLTLPDATRFTFEAGGLPVELEESIYFAAPEGPKACWQIVVHARAAETPKIAWSLIRVAEPSASADAADSEPAPGADEF